MEGPQAQKRAQLVAGVLLVVLGVLFFVLQSIDMTFFELWWPSLIVMPGLALLVIGLVTGERGAFLAIPGCVLIAIGGLLAFQNATGLWATWAYLWGLVGPGAVGVGLAIFGARSRKPQVAAVGWRLALAGVVVALVLGVFFELVVGLSGPAGPLLGRIVWPLALIVIGVWLMVPKRKRR